jgi:hypothetical protein
VIILSNKKGDNFLIIMIPNESQFYSPHLAGVGALPFILTFRQSCWGSLFFKIIFLVAFGGLFLSILGTLSCDFLGQQQQQVEDQTEALTFRARTDNIFTYKNENPMESQIIQQQKQQAADINYAWLGIFKYQSIDNDQDDNQDSSSSPQCIQHDREYMFGHAPYQSLVVAQACAIVAPFLCTLSFVLIFMEFTAVCWCQYNRRLSTASLLLLVAAAVIQEGPLVMFLDPAIW